ncbi:MAG: GLUG motif-containing protein, partial [Rikenellaceae bacterium]
ESLYTSAVATAYNAAYFTEPANQPEVEASVSGTTAIFKWKNVSSALSTVDVLSGSTTVATYSYDELAAGFTDAKVASGTLASSFTYNATFVYTADGDFTDVTVSIPAADNSGTGYTIDTDGTWLISNANGLAAFLNTVEDLENSGATKSLSLNARLTDHIDLSTLYGDDLDNWSPLGSVWGSGYAGTFDGDGYTINGLYLVATDGGEFKAMFGVLTGTVKNLTLRNPVISSTGMNVGAFVGNCNAGTLTGCSVVGSGASIIGAENCVGGLVGTLQGAGTVSDCYNEATVTTTASNCGGIVGYMNNASAVVDNCSNAGTIVSSTTYFGGVVGYDNGGGTISNCSNSGTFDAVGSYAGGIVGATKGTVTACTNSADLTSTATNFAGIAGYNNAGTVSDCRNTGYLYSTATYLGGIVGYNSGLLVGCGNAGTIYSTARYIGGITGYNTSVIANCHNEAEGWVGTTDYTAGGVTAHNNASAYVIGCSNAGTLGDTVGPDGATISNGGQHGGVIGYDAGGYVVGCYNTGSVTAAGTAANTCVGGIVGTLTTGTLFYGCYSTGDLSGIVSNNSHGYVSGATGSTVTYDNFSYCFYVDVDDDTLTDGAPTARLVDTTTSESATTLYDASSIAGVNAQITNMNTAIATALGTIQAAVTSYTINDYYFVAGTDSTVDSPSIVEVVAAQ